MMPADFPSSLDICWRNMEVVEMTEAFIRCIDLGHPPKTRPFQRHVLKRFIHKFRSTSGLVVGKTPEQHRALTKLLRLCF